MDDKEMSDFDKKWEADGKAADEYAAKHCLTLKKIKYFEAGSEETNCFRAEIYKGASRSERPATQATVAAR